MMKHSAAHCPPTLGEGPASILENFRATRLMGPDGRCRGRALDQAVLVHLADRPTWSGIAQRIHLLAIMREAKPCTGTTVNHHSSQQRYRPFSSRQGYSPTTYDDTPDFTKPKLVRDFSANRPARAMASWRRDRWERKQTDPEIADTFSAMAQILQDHRHR